MPFAIVVQSRLFWMDGQRWPWTADPRCAYLWDSADKAQAVIYTWSKLHAKSRWKRDQDTIEVYTCIAGVHPLPAEVIELRQIKDAGLTYCVPGGPGIVAAIQRVMIRRAERVLMRSPISRDHVRGYLIEEIRKFDRTCSRQHFNTLG